MGNGGGGEGGGGEGGGDGGGGSDGGGVGEAGKMVVLVRVCRMGFSVTSTPRKEDAAEALLIWAAMSASTLAACAALAALSVAVIRTLAAATESETAVASIWAWVAIVEVSVVRVAAP